MKFLVPNYSCLQNPWLGGYCTQIPVLSALCFQLNLLNPLPPRKNSWLRYWYTYCVHSLYVLLSLCWFHCKSWTVFCTFSLSLTDWFLSRYNWVIPKRCLKNVICDASSICSSLFFSIQASLWNFKATLAVILWILNFVSLVICFPKFLRIISCNLLHVCSLSSKSNITYPRCIKYDIYSVGLSFMKIYTLCIRFPLITLYFVLVLDMFIV